MRVKLTGVSKIGITGDHIRLDALLKYAAVVSSGGEAKALIRSGGAEVCGASCTQRGKKVKPGDTVRCGGVTLIVAVK